MGKLKKIGILTSGGDAPGMNAAIRGLTLTAIDNDIAHIPFNKVIKLKEKVNPEELLMVEILSV